MRPKATIVFVACVFGSVVLCSDEVDNDASATTHAPNMMDTITAFMDKAMQSPDLAGISRKILEADISTSCTIGLLKFMRGIRALEPWAVRLIDATAKYPTGLFQGTWADIGAYDECIETIVKDEYGNEKIRGQYCNVYVRMMNDTSFIDAMLPAFLMSHERTPEILNIQKDERVPGIRLGICFISDCDKKDMQALANTLITGPTKITVKNCVTGEPVLWTTAQLVIASLLGALILVSVISTIIDVRVTQSEKLQSMPARRSKLMKCITAFSIPASTRLLLAVSHDKTDEAYSYRFLHGLRFFSLFWIVLGHTSIAFDPIVSRFVNLLEMAGSWSFCVFSSAFLSVDTFFFLSGFLLAYNIVQQDANKFLVFLIAIIRRQIRVTVPLVFCIGCFYLVPLLTSGPNSEVLFDKFYNEVQTHWWKLLLQVRNFAKASDLECFSHLWYLSTDFQLFVIGLCILLIFRNKWFWMNATFLSLSLICSCISAWQMSSENYLPVIPPVVDKISTLADTFNYVYMTPWNHGTCFFIGCATSQFIKKYKDAKISKVLQVLLWCISLSCGAACILSRHHWNPGTIKTGAAENIAFAFFDRLMWAAFLAWLTFSCATGGGGFLCRFLSWGAFVPLSRLSYGIYIIHMPYFVTSYYVARERVFYSFFTVISKTFSIFVWSALLSYIVFVICECPTGRIEKMFFMPERLKMTKQQKKLEDSDREHLGIRKKFPELVISQANPPKFNGNANEYYSHL
ncbi:nose resistant to fluoxetine protein 6-like [Ixodes scapularis]|uniref:nose resistant to fluoxetine protein 6-like n=1 Tax=Ixodes scapularis TaxID=6945 RepID=UPI001C390D01|nr:nose resistant to fluoxetine protein 6-like [Ixodes scapularis]